MALSLPVAALGYMRAPAPKMMDQNGLQSLAKSQNPVLGYWDPIGLADIDLWGQGTEASIGARALHRRSCRRDAAFNSCRHTC